LVGLEIFGQKKTFPFWKGFYHFGNFVLNLESENRMIPSVFSY